MPKCEGFLAEEDIRRLTGVARASEQVKWLHLAGIPFKRRGAVVLVLWTHVEQWIEGKPTTARTGINWAALEEINAKTDACHQRISRKSHDRGL